MVEVHLRIQTSAQRFRRRPINLLPRRKTPQVVKINLWFRHRGEERRSFRIQIAQQSVSNAVVGYGAKLLLDGFECSAQRVADGPCLLKIQGAGIQTHGKNRGEKSYGAGKIN